MIFCICSVLEWREVIHEMFETHKRAFYRRPLYIKNYKHIISGTIICWKLFYIFDFLRLKMNKDNMIYVQFYHLTYIFQRLEISPNVIISQSRPHIIIIYSDVPPDLFDPFWNRWATRFQWNLINGSVLGVVSMNNIRFCGNNYLKKLPAFKVIEFVCNSEENNNLIFHI